MPVAEAWHGIEAVGDSSSAATQQRPHGLQTQPTCSTFVTGWHAAVSSELRTSIGQPRAIFGFARPSVVEAEKPRSAAGVAQYQALILVNKTKLRRPWHRGCDRSICDGDLEQVFPNDVR
jgi:hypothetical protein